MRSKFKLLIGIISPIFILASVVFFQHSVAYADTNFTISGHFSDKAGNPVANAPLRVHSATSSDINFTTDSSGNYSISVAPDKYVIDSRGAFNHGGMNNIYLFGPYYATSNPNQYFIDATGSDVTQDLRLDDVVLNVNFVDHNNQPISGAQVSVTSQFRQGGTSVAVGYPSLLYTTPSNFNSTVSPTDINGATSAKVLRGVGYNVCGIDPISSTIVCTTYTPSADSSTVTLTAPAHYTISGHFTDKAGNPVPNAALRVHSATGPDINVNTDSNGYYSVNVTPDKYVIDSRSTFSHGGMNDVYLYGPYYATSNPNQYFIDATSSNMTQDLKLDDVLLNVSFVDQDNQPISGADVSIVAQYRQGGTSVAVGYPDLLYTTSSNFTSTTAPTDITGATSGTVLNGLAYDVCAVDPISSVQYCVSYTPTQNVNSLTISQGPLPAAPTNLTAPSPTQTPQLTWDAVTNATSYNVYRNGTLIGTSATNSYTDNTATSGNYTYYVTAVRYSSGESGPSNTINVTVDTTAPVVVDVQQVWNTTKQRTDVTLIFSEPVSGLPQGWYGSGTSYTKAFYNTNPATVTFVDAQGNPGSTVVTPIGPQ